MLIFFHIVRAMDIPLLMLETVVIGTAVFVLKMQRNMTILCFMTVANDCDRCFCIILTKNIK